MISEVTNPVRKTIYKGKDALAEYGDGDFWGGVAEAGAVGALTSAAYGGTVGRIGKTSGVYADANSVAEHIEQQQKRILEGELSPDAEVQARKNIKADLEMLSARLQKASPKARERILSLSGGMDVNFDAEGKIRPEIAAKLDADIKAAGDTSSGLDRRYYSATARGREGEIIEGLAAQGTKVFEGELTAKESANLKKAKAVHNKLRSLGYVNTDFVLAETMKNDNAYLDGRTIVLGKDSLTDGSYVKHLIHETTHFTEGTKEWMEVAKHVFGKDGSGVSALIDRVKQSGYGVTDADAEAVLTVVREGKLGKVELTEAQQTLVTEVVSMQMEETFGSEAAVKRLVAGNETLARRLWERIKAFLQTFGKSKDERAEIKALRHTEELFRKALGEGGGAYIRDEVTRDFDEKMQVGEKNPQNDVDNEGEVRYSKKKQYKQISKQEYAVISSRIAEDNSKLLVQKKPLPNFGVARSANYFYVYENFAFGEFGVLKQIKIDAADKAYLSAIEMQIRSVNGKSTYTSASDVNRMLGALQGQRRRNRGNNADGSIGRSDRNDGGISFEKSRGDGIGHNRGSDENRRNVNHSRKALGEGGGAYIRDEVTRDFDEKMQVNEENAGDSVDIEAKVRYAKKVPMRNDFATQAMIWAHSDGTEVGEQRTLTNGKKTVIIQKTDDGYAVVKSFDINNRDQYKTILERVRKNNESLYGTLRGSIDAYESIGNEYGTRSGFDVGQEGYDRPNGGIHQVESRSNGNGIAEEGNGNSQEVKRSRKVSGDVVTMSRGRIAVLRDSYTDAERESILRSPQNIIASSIEDVQSFVSEVPKESKFLFVGKVPPSAIEKIKQVYELSADKFSLVLHSDELRHVMKHHGNAETEELRGQIAVNAQNIDLVIAAVMDPDSVEKSVDASGTVSLVFKKETEGRITAVTVLSQKKKALTLKSAWITKEKQHISQPSDVQAPNQTPNSESSMNTVSVNSIPDFYENVKGEVKKSRKVTADTVTMSRGQLDALRANYHGDKVFAKKDVTAALGTVNGFSALPAALRTELINRIWSGYNVRLHSQGFDTFTELAWHRLHAELLQDVGFEMTEDEIRAMDEQIVAALNAIVKSGKPSVKAKLESAASAEGYRRQADFWRGEHARAVERNKLLGKVKFAVEGLADLKKGRYVNASNVRNDTFSVAIDELARMNWRGGLVRDTKIREHFGKLRDWYGKGNALYFDGDGNPNGRFRQDVKEALESLGKSGNEPLTNADLLAAESVVRYFANEIKTYGTIYKDEKRIDAAPEVKRYIETVLRAKEINLRCGALRVLMQNRFARLVADPAMLMRQADGYLGGFFTEQYEELRKGKIEADVLERELAEKFEKFMTGNKAYGKRYNTATVTFEGVEMPLQEAISLAMTMRREHAFAGLAYAGFEIDGKDARKDISKGFAADVEKRVSELYKDLPPEELLTLTEEVRDEIDRKALADVVEEKRKALEKQFTDEDRALISLMEKTFEKCREIKEKIDNILYGDSNVTKGYYFPIRRTGRAEHVDAMSAFEGDRVSSLSMNKETVKNAHGLFIEPVHVVFMRHVKATSLYSGLGVFTDNLNRLYNLDISQMIDEDTKKAATEAGRVVVDISENEEIKGRIAASTRSKYDVIRQYLIEKYKNYTFTMSDGRQAVMDNSDAQKLSRNANNARTAQLGNLGELIERAKYDHSAYGVEHDKFVDFHYYAVTAKYNGEEFNLWINVGVAKNDGKNHIYAITNKKEDAPAHYGVGGPVGNRIQNASPTDSIPQNGENVKGEAKKSYGAPQTLRDTIAKSTKFMQEMFDYFKELKADVEGISKKRGSDSFGNDAIAAIRGAYATFQLGANPKVWVTQLSSLLAATNLVDADCIIKGFRVSGKDVDEHCRLAWLRDNDSAAAMAQAVKEQQNAVQRASRNALQKVRDLGMVLIGKTDRFVIKRLFAACQVQVEKNGGAKVGTGENKTEAGKLLTRVILETQQNSLATERSAAMRSGNELIRSFTMFSADAMKVGARFVDAFGELSSLRQQMKDARKAGNAAEIKRLEGELKRAKGQCVRSTVALVATAVFNALIAYGFKWLYRRDDEEDLGTFFADTFGNMIGGIPLIRDIWSYYSDGYELDNFLLGTINDVLGTTADTFTLVKDAASGKEVTRTEALGMMRKVLYAAGQLSGIPTRNLYNVTTGMLNRVSPEAGYAVESNFYKQAYSSDLKKAIEAEDEDMVATIAGLMLDEKLDGKDAATRKALRSLIEQGHSVLPRSVGDTVSLNGTEIALTGAQQKRFRTVYAVGEEAVGDLVKLARFQSAAPDVQAKAVQFIYDVYWDLALEDVTGEDLAEKNVLFAEAIDIEKLAIAVALARSLEADKDKEGNSIAGTKKRKVEQLVQSLHLTAAQKYMVMGYLGYKCTNGEGAVKGYISGLNLSKSEKEKLVEYGGYSRGA